MRILSMTAQKADSTGSGVYLTELVKGFEKLGHQQAILCGTTPEDTLTPPGSVKLFPVYYDTPELPFPVCGMSDEMPYESTRYRGLTEEMTGQLFSAFEKAVIRAVEEFQPDVILCHHLYFLAALTRQLYPDIPVYGLCHGSDLRQIRKNPWQRDWITSRIRQLTGLFALHEEQKQTICETYGVPESMVTVMGTGYNSDVFYIDEKALKPEGLQIVFAGKISEKKGVFSLIRAMEYLPNPENTELILAGGAGNAEEFSRIQQLAEASPCQVSFPGKLNHNQLARLMNEGDVFVLPSFYEGLPLVLIEAMACGLKAVCTDLPGIRPWLDRAIPGHGVRFVQPPNMRN